GINNRLPGIPVVIIRDGTLQEGILKWDSVTFGSAEEGCFHLLARSHRLAYKYATTTLPTSIKPPVAVYLDSGMNMTLFVIKFTISNLTGPRRHPVANDVVPQVKFLADLFHLSGDGSIYISNWNAESNCFNKRLAGRSVPPRAIKFGS